MSEFSRNDIIEILKDDSNNDWLFSLADKTREEYVGDEVHLRGLIEFSNICKRQCKYCGLRCEDKFIDRYRISKENIIGELKSRECLFGYSLLLHINL